MASMHIISIVQKLLLQCWMVTRVMLLVVDRMVTISSEAKGLFACRWRGASG